FAHRARERTVLPFGAVVTDQIAPDQVAGAGVIVAGHRDQRAVEAPGHVLDEARLAAAGRALEPDGKLPRMAVREDVHFIAEREIVGSVLALRHRHCVHAAPTGTRSDAPSSAASATTVKRGA